MTAFEIGTEIVRQIDFIRNAPIPFLSALLILTMVLWRLMEFRFGTELANIKSHNDLLIKRLGLLTKRPHDS